MSIKLFRSVVSLVLTLAMAAIFPMVFTQEVQAASTKTFYVVKYNKEVAKFDDGQKDSYVRKMTYDKNGLLKTQTYDDGSKDVYTRDKYGYPVTRKRYDSNGKLAVTFSYVYTYGKNNCPKKLKYYYKERGGIKQLLSTCNFTYYSNKNVKKATEKGQDGSWVFIYWKNGNLKKTIYKGKDGSSVKEVFDKHGSYKTWVNKDSDSVWKEKHTTLQYDKNGNLEKDVYTVADTHNGKTYKEKRTETIVYTYDSHKNIKKSVLTRKIVPEQGEVMTDKITNTYKYKKVKVAKKYWHLVNN